MLLIYIVLIALIACVVLLFVILNKLITGKWFGGDWTFINPRSISQEIVAVLSSTVTKYNTIKPQAASVYIVFPTSTSTTPTNIEIDTSYLTRGVLLTFVNDSAAIVSTNLQDSSNSPVKLTGNTTSVYVVSTNKKLRLLTLW
jgi:hypothetical protein